MAILIYINNIINININESNINNMSILLLIILM